MRKKLSILALGAVLAVTIFSATPVSGETENALDLLLTGVEKFPDVSSSNANQLAIEYLHHEEILKGDDETGEFRAGDNLNRAEFATVLARIAGADPKVDEFHSCFPDVRKEWFAPYVCWAKEEGYVTGFKAGEMAGKYGPSLPLLNAEAIVVISRVNEWDTDPTGEWYEPAMNYAREHKIIESEKFDGKMTRGLMAESIFRTRVVNYLDQGVYTGEDGEKFVVDELAPVQDEGSAGTQEGTQEEEPVTEGTQETVIMPGGKMTLVSREITASTPRADAPKVAVMGLSGIVNGDYYTIITGLTLHGSDDTNPRNIKKLYVLDDKTSVMTGDPVTAASSPDWKNNTYALKGQDLVFRPDNKSSYTVYAELDGEVNGTIQLSLESASDLTVTGSTIMANFPLIGPEITIRNGDEIGTNPDEFPRCALFDEEYNLPFKTGGKVKGEPITAGAPVSAPSAGHIVEPIDQGGRGICAAAAVYSSLRWFEKELGLSKLVEDGAAGLEAWVNALYGVDVTTTTKQLDKLVSELNKQHPGCIEADYDTQAGANVACDELQEHHAKKCDIPLVFYCTKTDPATGNPVTGAGAERWGHVVDLVDVQIDNSDSNKCTITFANSWKDSTNPRPDVDGLGYGRYERAKYNDDSEDFDVESSWGNNYKCELYAAAYICIDKDKCADKK